MINLEIRIFIGLVLPVWTLANSTSNLEIISEWKNLVFSFNSVEQEQYAISMNYYDPIGQKRPFDGDIFVTEDGRLRKFLSIPRVEIGIPFTLAEVTDNNDNPKGPIIRAYPNTEMHLERSCDGIYSALRIWVEPACHRLWVIDCGRDFFPHNQESKICPPKIVAFNLNTNTLEFQYEIPKEYFNPEVSAFNGITLLPSLRCDQTTGYVTDARGPGGLIVFKRNRNSFKSWRVYSSYFPADPQYYNTTIANESFNFIDGLYTAAPSIGNLILYFHPFASHSEYAVQLFWLNFEELWSGEQDWDFLFQKIGERPTQSSVEIVDSRGNLWFTMIDPALGVFCWNPNKEYKEENFKLVIENSEVLQFVAGLKIRHIPGKGEAIVGTSNKMQKHKTGTVNPNETNYRIFVFPIENVEC